MKQAVRQLSGNNAYSIQWNTPKWFFEQLNRRFQFTLDPCCTRENALCKKYWHKTMPTGRLNCKYAPMKCHENILIFSRSAACSVKNPVHAMKYYPQFEEGKPYTAYHGSKRKSTNYDTKWERDVLTVNTGTRYPRDVITYKHEKDKYHPTQKPVALLEYIIKTYTEPGDVVVDSFMGSGSTGVACVNTGRDFIGIELDRDYFAIANMRIETAMQKQKEKEVVT